MPARLEWLGHDSFRITGGETVIYIDPWKLEGGAAADLILITHEHYDHCVPEDVARVLGPNTVVLGNVASLGKLKEAGVSADLRVVKPGDRLEAAGVLIEVLPAYNLNKFRSPGVPFHPKESGHVGYKLMVDGESIYHTGDSDNIPEFADVDCDILLIPVSGTYVMTAQEAVEAAKAVRPRKYAVPMHYGEIVGTEDDARLFSELYDGEVRILSKVV